MSEDEIYDYIAQRKEEIELIKKMKERIATSETEEIRVKIQTKHWYGFSEPFLIKENQKIISTKKVMLRLLDEMKKEAKSEINLSIDLLIEKRGNTNE